jgi:ribosomal protein S18 acetylase RimI-like enzyme
MDEIVLRSAGPEDARDVARLWYSAFTNSLSHVLGERAEEFLADWFTRDPSPYDRTTLACLNDEVVGYIQIQTRQEMQEEKRLRMSQMRTVLSVASRFLGPFRMWVCAARLAYAGSWPIPDGELYIHMLGIDSAFRGKGIGTRLLEFAEEQARSRNIPRLSLGVVADNTGAKRLYERFGFVAGPLSTALLIRWASGDEAYYRMVKELSD